VDDEASGDDSGVLRPLDFRLTALGFVLGVALQLQRAWVEPPQVAAALLLAGLVLAAALARRAAGRLRGRTQPEPAWRARGAAADAVSEPSMAGPGWMARVLAGMLLALAAAGVGYGLASLHAGRALAERLAPELVGRELLVVGRVADLPVDVAGARRFVFEPEAPRAAGLPARLLVTWYDPPDAAALSAGSRWQLPLRLKPPHGALNRHGFDYELHLLERGIGAAGHVRPKGDWRLLERQASAPYALARLRQTLKERIVAALGPERPLAGIVVALAVGDQSAIEREDWRLFRDTGISHLVAISGLHVTMLAWLATLAVGRLWRRSARLMDALPTPHAARCGGLALAWAYALVAGFGIPAARTVLMLSAWTLARMSGLRHALVDVLAAAALVVLAFDPWALLQPGFWLSFAAVGFLGWADPAAARGESVVGWRARLAAATRAQAVASLALAPLTVLFFQQVSLVGPLANALAIPLVSLAVTPLALVGLVLPAPLSDGAWVAAHSLLQGLHAVLGWLAAFPFAVWSLPAPPAWALAAALAAIAWLLLPAAIGRLRFLALPLLLPLVLHEPPRPPFGRFEAHVLDVGQGTAVLIRGAGSDWLYDTGPSYRSGSDAGERIVVPYLRALGVRRLDALVVSHRDDDHAGGVASVLAALPVARVLSSVDARDPMFAGAADRVERCRAGQTWQHDGLRFELLHPQPQHEDDPRFKPNDRSCVLKVVAADGAALLLTGDAERRAEQAMLERDAAALRATVLLAGHHGSKTSTGDALLAAVAPQAVLVQVGYRSRYGHPHASVVARIEAAGLPLLRTDCLGGLVWTSDAAAAGSGQFAQARSERWRYWRHTCEAGTPGADRLRIPAGRAFLGMEFAKTSTPGQQPAADFSELP
jgi:competence protein ComEC